MPKKQQMVQGKAFEYACFSALKSRLEGDGVLVSVIDNRAYKTACKAFRSLLPEEKELHMNAAVAAVRMILPLEPRLEHSVGEQTLFLSISADALGKGVGGDVRDIVCLRQPSGWEIGFSCKHNHQALRHPRITEAKDFGTAWLGYPCGRSFLDKMNNILKPLDELQRQGKSWKDIPDKKELFYKPVLVELIKEIKRLCGVHKDVPEKLLVYFFGSKDFYKIISLERDEQTKVVAFNINGTLNQAAGDHKARYKVRKIKYPTRLVDVDFKKQNERVSDTTISIIFDGGWQIDMRLHNADSKVKATGLKFDVQLAGQPNDVYQQQRSWNE